jgi:hypothetical protein
MGVEAVVGRQVESWVISFAISGRKKKVRTSPNMQ